MGRKGESWEEKGTEKEEDSGPGRKRTGKGSRVEKKEGTGPGSEGLADSRTQKSSVEYFQTCSLVIVMRDIKIAATGENVSILGVEHSSELPCKPQLHMITVRQ